MVTPASTKTKSGNIHIRISSDVKKIIEKAVAASGQSMTDFATRSLLNSANEVLEHEYTTTLTNRDRDRLMQLLDQDSEPSAELREAARIHKDLILE
ncbi:hypothetical protein BH20ACI2_BH20ACI2_12260 [soil metagenome]